MSRTVDLVYAIGLACAVALAFAMMACGAVQSSPSTICDPAVVHRELVLCVTDADVPSTPDQMAQVVTWYEFGKSKGGD